MLNLRKDPWILVRDEKGNTKHVTLDEARTLPLSAVEYHRVEVNFAVFMLLIALDNYRSGEADFIQDEKADAGKHFEIAKLFIDNPGVSTLKANKDHFIKRDQRISAICPQCYPGMAYAYTQLMGAGGRGYRPGAASDRCLYIVDADTIGEMINRNRLPEDSPHISRYFTSPVYLSPVEADAACTCQLCGVSGRCYSGVNVVPIPAVRETTSAPAHPHASLSTSGIESSYAQWKTKFHAVTNIADVGYATPPEVVMLNAEEGDTLRFLGLENPQGTIRNCQSFTFTVPERWNWTGQTKLFNYVARKLFMIKHRSMDFVPELAGNEYGQLSALILERGMSVGVAGVHILDSMFSTPESSMMASTERLRSYVQTRKAFMNIHRVGKELKERCLSEQGQKDVPRTVPPRRLDPDATRFYRDILKKINPLPSNDSPD